MTYSISVSDELSHPFGLSLEPLVLIILVQITNVLKTSFSKHAHIILDL